MQPSHLKALTAYLVSVVLLAVYGIQVCPFLESLPPKILILTFFIIFAFAFLVRLLLFDKHENFRLKYLRTPWQQLYADICIWVAVAISAAGWNFFRYGFPLESGLKVLVGCLALGALTSTSLALDTEKNLILSARNKNLPAAPDSHLRFMSLSTKFLIFLAACLLLFATIAVLLFFKDFQYFLANRQTDTRILLRGAAIEVSFVLSIILAGCFIIARQYSFNLRQSFLLIQETFAEVERGNLQTYAVSVSNDELSLIASHTNKMISGLQEKERIKSVFGKYMSREVAELILKSESGSELGGRNVNATILFVDVRNYTSWSEKLSPQQVLEILNLYFSRVVEPIHCNNGVVDKFIGDAVMAVFGLQGSDSSIEQAVNAAFAIRDNLPEINELLKSRNLPPIENGIGIHYGPVVAGNLGAPNRLEYTVIGDTVNTASRIEGLAKDASKRVIISEACFERLPKNLKERFAFVGNYELKGKSEPFPLYGAV